MDLFVQSFFVLVNSFRLVETPELEEEYASFVWRMHQDILEEQLYLQSEGVSFEYTDSIDARSRRDLIKFISSWREEHPKPQIL